MSALPLQLLRNSPALAETQILPGLRRVLSIAPTTTTANVAYVHDRPDFVRLFFFTRLHKTAFRFSTTAHPQPKSTILRQDKAGTTHSAPGRWRWKPLNELQLYRVASSSLPAHETHRARDPSRSGGKRRPGGADVAGWPSAGVFEIEVLFALRPSLLFGATILLA